MLSMNWWEAGRAPERVPNAMPQIIVALDQSSADEALALVDLLGDAISYYKVASPLYTRSGPAVVRELRARGRRVFLDLKFHDIPNTVAAAVQSAADLDVDLLTLHTGGGLRMMEAARTAAGDTGPRLLGVTILTSFSAVDIEQTWDKEILSVRDEVTRLAALAQQAGLHGIVASALEVETIKRRFGPAFLAVTPGIRPTGAAAGDQSRTATPADAARAGADFLVIGRPIYEAADPAAVVAAAKRELEPAAGVTT